MKIAIIGAGASGIMCTANLLENCFNGEILLIDKNNNIGKKVLITGGGRCNVTTGIVNNKKILEKYIRGSNFIKYAIHKYPPKKIIKRFENKGVKLKIENDMRVFPISNKSEDIIGVFNKLFYNKNNLKLQLNESVKKINKINKKFIIKTNKQDYLVDKVIIATGGNTYQNTGSSGDAYNWVKKLGHTITPLGPSLSSFLCNDKWVKKISGINFSDARIYFKNDYNKKYIEGSLLFTHFGISGPLAFTLSAYLAHSEILPQNPITINLQINKNNDYQFWNTTLQKDFLQNKNKQVKNILYKYLPKRFINILIEYFSINLNQFANSFTKKNRKKLYNLLSGGIEITLIGRRNDNEFVTAGGINTNEINSKTMESKKCSGLYFAGEVINVDALTGGFNLQSARSMGMLVAKNIVN